MPPTTITAVGGGQPYPAIVDASLPISRMDDERPASALRGPHLYGAYEEEEGLYPGHGQYPPVVSRFQRQRFLFVPNSAVLASGLHGGVAAAAAVFLDFCLEGAILCPFGESMGEKGTPSR